MLEMVTSDRARCCQECGSFGLAHGDTDKIEQWLCVRCRDQGANTAQEVEFVQQLAAPTLRQSLNNITASQIAGTKTAKKNAVEQGLPVRPTLKICLYIALQTRRPFMWNYTIPDIRGSWDWTVGEMFSQAWEKIKDCWEGRGMGHKEFDFALDFITTTHAFHDRSGKPAVLDPNFAGQELVLSEFFRKRFKPKDGLYGKPSDNMLGYIYLLFTVRSPIADNKRALSPSSSVEEIPPPKTIKTEVGDGLKVAHTHDTSEEKTSKSTANYKVSSSSVFKSTFGLSSTKVPQVHQPIPTPPPTTPPEGFETVRFTRIYPRIDRNDTVVKVRHNEEEEAFVQLKPFGFGQFKLAFKMMLVETPNVQWVAKRYYTMQASQDTEDVIPVSTVDEDQQYYLLWLEVAKGVNLQISLDEFRSKLKRKKCTQDTHKFSLTPSFLIEECCYPLQREPRSWIVEPYLAEAGIGQIVREQKIFGAEYLPQRQNCLEEKEFLPVALLDELHAWLHYFFEETSEGEAVPSDIQGFVYYKGKGRKAADHFQVKLFDTLVHSFARTQGPGDAGPPAMEIFIRKHVCNTLCKMAGLSRFSHPEDLLGSYDCDPEDIPFWRADEQSVKAWQTDPEIKVERRREKDKRPQEDINLLQRLLNENQGSYEKINQVLKESRPELAFGSRATFYRHLVKCGLEGYRKAAVRGLELRAALDTLPLYHHGRGFRGSQHALKLQGVHTSQAAVLQVMREYKPDALASRRLGPGKQLRRFPIVSAGPNEQWSVDGHDKLSKHGFGIYGIRDVYSGKYLAMHVFPSNRLAINIQWLYLKTVLDMQGFPIQIASDKGSEVGLMFEMQQHFREQYSHEGLRDVPPFVQLPSIRNITIERAWGVVCKEVDVLVEEQLYEGVRRGFVSTNQIHCVVFWWLFAPLLQQTLNEHCRFHNTYKVRHQAKKSNPSGASRNEIYQNPERWHGDQCLQKYPMTDQPNIERTMRELEMEGQLSWLLPNVQELLDQAKMGLGTTCPVLQLETAWDIFYLVLPWVRDDLERIFGCQP
ncbi:hypothetical protein M231_02047 [Tremella mesenterica]|uniref:Alpha-type protein kinase domain-containing protein n=1 Tax=Tremella mesenterica TaxID=5217 RepID=A0A4Q1BRR1_TREME|nr:hypothetical protein M231_02047 [Tremella mesenterica]